MPRSIAEVRLAHSVLEGNAKDSGMSRSYAQEVVDKMHGKSMSSLPAHASKKPARKNYRMGQKAR